MSSAYLRLLIFLPAILISACASSNPAFCMMCCAYKLNKQGDNIQPWCTAFPIWTQSVAPCPVLTVASWPEYRFLRRQVRWSGIPISWRIFHSLLWFTQSKSHGLYSPWTSPGQNTGVGSLSLLQGIFLTQGSNPGLPHCKRWILYQLRHKGSPIILEWVAYPFSSGSSRSRNQTGVSCIAGGFFTNWTIREAPHLLVRVV